MKKLLFTALAAAALASCSKNTEPMPNATDATGPQVQITLQSDGATRAFFDEAATATDAEKEIGSLTVYVFNASGDFILRRRMTPAEIVARNSRFTLPNSTAGTNCSFYVVANANYGDVESVSAMHLLVENVTLDGYNGDFEQTTNRRKRDDGFVMTGSTTASIAATGSTTTVGVTLKRIVAKIAVRAYMSTDFRANHAMGSVVISEVTLTRGKSQSYSYPNSSGAHSGPNNYSHTQQAGEAGGASLALFYTFETPAGLPQDQCTALVLKGYFDADADENTTYDRSDVEYTVNLTGAGNGEIKRNGYYRVSAEIDGLSGDAVTVNFTVADWETSVTQTVELGN